MMQLRHGRRALLLASACSVATLVGCSPSDSSRERLDYWANRLKVRSWGKVTVEDYAGSNNFSDETPTLALLMSSEPSAVTEHAKRALISQGFTLNGDDWSSRDGDEYRVVNIRALPKGAKYYLPGAKRTLTLTNPTVRIELQVTS